mmetsp:Transcript_16166/g.38334  ORF Transcript_16166/g.38334 Transcript_16166/m.38334 type:complete len:128 (-) Transcript_16166:1313-1696(-)
MSSACLPISLISPWCMTTILSASMTVLRRCAMMIVVLPSFIWDSWAWMAFSVIVSSADVASSSKRMGGFLSSVRATATRCFSPPLRRRPRSPTTVSYPIGNLCEMGSWIFAAEATLFTSSSSTPGLP